MKFHSVCFTSIAEFTSQPYSIKQHAIHTRILLERNLNLGSIKKKTHTSERNTHKRSLMWPTCRQLKTRKTSKQLHPTILCVITSVDYDYKHKMLFTRFCLWCFSNGRQKQRMLIWEPFLFFLFFSFFNVWKIIQRANLLSSDNLCECVITSLGLKSPSFSRKQHLQQEQRTFFL